MLEYKPEDYIFPELYVEEASGECVSIDLDRRIYWINPRGSMCKIVYEEGWKLIVDPVESRVTRSFLTVIPWEDYRGVYVWRDAKVDLVEARGAEVYIVSREGSLVDERSVLAYILTRKGETRTRRARSKGVIAYIAWEPLIPPRYVFVITRDCVMLDKARV